MIKKLLILTAMLFTQQAVHGSSGGMQDEDILQKLARTKKAIYNMIDKIDRMIARDMAGLLTGDIEKVIKNMDQPRYKVKGKVLGSKEKLGEEMLLLNYQPQEEDKKIGAVRQNTMEVRNKEIEEEDSEIKRLFEEIRRGKKERLAKSLLIKEQNLRIAKLEAHLQDKDRQIQQQVNKVTEMRNSLIKIKKASQELKVVAQHCRKGNR